MMKLLKTFSKRYCFRQVTPYLVVCCLFFTISPSAILAGPKGRALGHSKLHGNPLGNLHSGGVLTPINIKVNPAGIIVGTGGIRVNGTVPNISNTGTVTNQIGTNGYLVMGSGEGVLSVQPGSSVFVEINSLVGNKLGVKKVKNNGKIHILGQGLILAAGDGFSGAIVDLGSLASSLTVSEPIGAKGPNPVHGGQHPKKGDGNPGGGNGNGHWGEGNNGNGAGNIWTGNQGRGVGEGMAGGSKPDPDPNPNLDPDPDPDPESPEPNPQAEPEPEINIDAAPLPDMLVVEAEETEFEEGGCPVLMEWLVDELGVAEDIQIQIASTFIHSTDINSCEAAARLREAAEILADKTRVAALESVINEFVAPSAPISEEQLASIAMAFADQAGDGTYYAAARQWIDAFAEYVRILTDEMGYSADDSMVIVMDKYGAAIEESGNAGVIVYIEACLAAFAKNIDHRKFPESKNLQLPQETSVKCTCAGAGAAIPYASAESIHTSGGLGILGLVGAILAGLVMVMLPGLLKSKQGR